MGTLANGSTGTNDTIVGIIDENAQAVFIDRTNFAIYRFSTLAVSGDNFTASFHAFAGAGNVFPNGQQTDTGTVTGTIAQHSSISGSASIGGATGSAPFNASYQKALYEMPASYATIAGTYSYSLNTSQGTDNATFTVTSDGKFSGSDNFGCTFSGVLNVPSSTYNAYEVGGSSNCSGTMTGFTGFATYAPASGNTPANLTIEYDNGSTLAVAAVANKK